MTKKIYTVGSMTFDLFVRPQDMTVMRFFRENACDQEYMAFPYGSKIPVSEVHEKYGGGGHNTAVGLTRLGLEATPIGRIGSDTYGTQILKNLEREKIATTFVQHDPIEKTGFSVIVTSFEGERTVFGHSGSNRNLESFAPEIFADCDGFFFNHISSDTVAVDAIFAAIKNHFLAFPEKFLAWNPGKEQLRQGALAFVDFFPVVDLLLLNRQEAELFTGRKAHPYKSTAAGSNGFPAGAIDCTEIFQVFIQQGVHNVVITDGKNGAQLCDGKNIYFCGIDATSPRVDTLGAGDAFGSALFAAMIEQKELSFALKYATINAASVVSQIGAQTGLLTQIELLKRVAATSVKQATQPFSSPSFS